MIFRFDSKIGGSGSLFRGIPRLRSASSGVGVVVADEADEDEDDEDEDEDEVVSGDVAGEADDEGGGGGGISEGVAWKF